MAAFAEVYEDFRSFEVQFDPGDGSGDQQPESEDTTLLVEDPAAAQDQLMAEAETTTPAGAAYDTNIDPAETDESGIQLMSLDPPGFAAKTAEQAKDNSHDLTIAAGELAMTAETSEAPTETVAATEETTAESSPETAVTVEEPEPPTDSATEVIAQEAETPEAQTMKALAEADDSQQVQEQTTSVADAPIEDISAAKDRNDGEEPGTGQPPYKWEGSFKPANDATPPDTPVTPANDGGASQPPGDGKPPTGGEGDGSEAGGGDEDDEQGKDQTAAPRGEKRDNERIGAMTRGELRAWLEQQRAMKIPEASGAELSERLQALGRPAPPEAPKLPKEEKIPEGTRYRQAPPEASVQFTPRQAVKEAKAVLKELARGAIKEEHAARLISFVNNRIVESASETGEEPEAPPSVPDLVIVKSEAQSMYAVLNEQLKRGELGLDEADRVIAQIRAQTAEYQTNLTSAEAYFWSKRIRERMVEPGDEIPIDDAYRARDYLEHAAREKEEGEN